MHKHEEVAKALENRNQRLTQEVSQLRLASSKAVKQFERRTTEGLFNESFQTNLYQVFNTVIDAMCVYCSL